MDRKMKRCFVLSVVWLLIVSGFVVGLGSSSVSSEERGILYEAGEEVDEDVESENWGTEIT